MPYCILCATELDFQLKCPSCGFEVTYTEEIPAGRNTLVRIRAKAIRRRAETWRVSKL